MTTPSFTNSSDRDSNKNQHDCFAATLDELGLADIGHDSFDGAPLLEVASGGFEVSVRVRLDDGTLQHWHIRDDSRFWSNPTDRSPSSRGASQRAPK